MITKLIYNVSKLKLLVLFFMCFNYAFSQTNYDFELWTKNGQFEDPDFWQSSNQLSSSMGLVSCYKSTNSYNGKYALTIIPFFIQQIGKTFPGYILQVMPIAKRINSIGLYYKYYNYNSNNDSSYFNVSFYKGRVDNNHKIGSCITYLKSNTQWMNIKSNIIWKTNETPDTMLIYFSTGIHSSVDSLIIDDIELSEYSANIKSLQFYSTKTYLNSQNELVLDSSLSENFHEVIIRNSIGQTVLNIKTSSRTIDLINLEQGTYTFEIIDDTKRVLSGKFLK
ncbi:MAG: hypothetical protein PSX81_07550 [bacterium]|nr:hypothetical protein [bacterium]